MMHPGWILLAAVGVLLIGILVLRLHAFLALVLAALTTALLTPQGALTAYAKVQVAKGLWTPSAADAFVASPAAERVAEAFGKTCAGIGILIAMASIIGTCLLASGAADRIVRQALSLFGQDRAPLAFLSSGYLLAIPVFFDTVFLLMVPLAKAMRLRTGRNYLLYVLAIVAGGTMTHSLVPPTPGPLYVADRLGINLGTMILAGCLIGAVTSSVGYLYGAWANQRWDLPLRDTSPSARAQGHNLCGHLGDALPPLWLSLLPIVLPVALIAGQTGLDAWIDAGRGSAPGWLAAVLPVATTMGNKNIAVTLGAGVALATLAWQAGRSRTEVRGQLASAVQAAITSAAGIILITAAGGAFGAAVQQSGVERAISQVTEGLRPLWVLPVAFLVTMLIRTAQGSATVAMITAAGLMEPFASPEVLGFHPVYLALAIGCGSKLFTWMNDSGFWIISNTAGMTQREALRTLTVQLALMGLVGLAATMLGAICFPLV